MAQQEWNAFQEFVRTFGWAVTLSLAAAYLVLRRLDVVKRLFVGRLHEQNEEREQLSEDTQRLIENLQGDAERQRRWRIEEAARYEEIVSALRADVSRLIRTVESSEAGNSRLRHALNDALTWGAAIRVKALRASVPVEAFPIDNLMKFDSELATRLANIFEEGDRLAAGRSPTTGGG